MSVEGGSQPLTGGLTRTSSLDDLRQFAQKKPAKQQKPSPSSTVSTSPPAASQATQAARTVQGQGQAQFPPNMPFAPPTFPYPVPYPYGPPGFGFNMTVMPGMFPGWPGGGSGPVFGYPKTKPAGQAAKAPVVAQKQGDKTEDDFVASCLLGKPVVEEPATMVCETVDKIVDKAMERVDRGADAKTEVGNGGGAVEKKEGRAGEGCQKNKAAEGNTQQPDAKPVPGEKGDEGTEDGKAENENEGDEKVSVETRVALSSNQSSTVAPIVIDLSEEPDTAQRQTSNATAPPTTLPSCSMTTTATPVAVQTLPAQCSSVVPASVPVPQSIPMMVPQQLNWASAPPAAGSRPNGVNLSAAASGAQMGIPQASKPVLSTAAGQGTVPALPAVSRSPFAAPASAASVRPGPFNWASMAIPVMSLTSPVPATVGPAVSMSVPLSTSMMIAPGVASGVPFFVPQSLRPAQSTTGPVASVALRPPVTQAKPVAPAAVPTIKTDADTAQPVPVPPKQVAPQTPQPIPGVPALPTEAPAAVSKQLPGPASTLPLVKASQAPAAQPALMSTPIPSATNAFSFGPMFPIVNPQGMTPPFPGFFPGAPGLMAWNPFMSPRLPFGIPGAPFMAGFPGRMPAGVGGSDVGLASGLPARPRQQAPQARCTFPQTGLNSGPGMMIGMVPVTSHLKVQQTAGAAGKDSKAKDRGKKKKGTGNADGEKGRNGKKAKIESAEENAAGQDGEMNKEGEAEPSQESKDLPLARRRKKRVPGGDPLQNQSVSSLCQKIRSNSLEFEANGRILRLKQYLRADAGPAVMDSVLDALMDNTTVEALYIQNFELGMFDEQLEHLVEVLKLGRIWALNVGENFNISLDAWMSFSSSLKDTDVAYLYVSEHHLQHTNLKLEMRNVIRENRKRAPARDPEVIKYIKNMWFNPKLPGASKTKAGGGCSGVDAEEGVGKDGINGGHTGLVSQPLLECNGEPNGNALASMDEAMGVVMNGGDLHEAGVEVLDARRTLRPRDRLARNSSQTLGQTGQQDLNQAAAHTGNANGVVNGVRSGKANGRVTRASLNRTVEHRGPGCPAANGIGENEGVSRGMQLRSYRKRGRKDEDAYGGPKRRFHADGASHSTKGAGSNVPQVAISPIKSEGGRTTFADMVNARLINPGKHKWTVGHEPDVEVLVKTNGAIQYKSSEYYSISSFALAVIRERNPGRRSCDGWKDVKWKGQRLETLRDQYFRR